MKKTAASFQSVLWLGLSLVILVPTHSPSPRKSEKTFLRESCCLARMKVSWEVVRTEVKGEHSNSYVSIWIEQILATVSHDRSHGTTWLEFWVTDF